MAAPDRIPDDRVPDAGRRAFLRGKTQAHIDIRPPWALAEPRFLDACTRCAACVERCPEQVLTTGTGGYPVFDATRGECTFCGACAEACKDGALDRGAVSPPFPWKAQVRLGDCFAARGIVCASCADGCPEHAIRVTPAPGGLRNVTLDEDACTGCGACVSACPAQAIDLRLPTTGDRHER